MAFLFFGAVFVLLGWLVCEYDIFATVPAAGPHTTITTASSSPPAPAGPVAQLPRRERRAHARAQSRSRSPPPVPEWARPGSLLSPPREPFRHVPAERHDTFLNVEQTEAFGQMKRVLDPVLGWKWVAVRGAELVSVPSLAAPASAPATPPKPVVSSPPLVPSPPPPPPPPVPAPLPAPAPPAPVAVSPPRPSVAALLAGIPSLPQGLTRIFPVEAPAPLPQLSFGMPLAAPISVPSSLAMVLPSFSPSVPVPPAAEAAGQPQSDTISGFAAPPLPPPPPPPPSTTFSLGDGSGPGAGAGSGPAPSDFGGGFAAPAPPPSSGGFGGFEAINFSFPSSSSSAPASRRTKSGKQGLKPRVIQDTKVDSFSGPVIPLSEEATFKRTLKLHPINTAGLVNNAHIMSARYQDICMDGLADINGYLPGSTLAAFEHNLRQKENGLRLFALLIRWQVDTGLPQPAGGSAALNQLIAVLARLDELVAGYIADNGQSEFESGSFPEWARSWRFLVKHLCEERGDELRRQLDPAVFGQLEDLVGRNQAHWARFRPSTAGRDLLG
ncbi:hypothetical protein PTMSG1_02732 [Pyrenophora teres f. maculata]|nr:hypothetical protein PTMSG1_02732 [Pyrenophora teres f. maculata]